MAAKSPLLLLTTSPSLFLASLLPSVFNPAQFARLDETILVISACNGTLLTPITTIKTLLPLGPFQVLINQMAAKRLFGAPQPLLNTQDTHTHPHTGTHAHLLTSLDRPCGLAKNTSGGTKRLHAGRQMPWLYKWKASLSLSHSLSACFSLSLFPSLWCGYNEHYKPPWHSALLRGFGKLPSLFLTNCLIDALFLLMIRICPPPSLSPFPPYRCTWIQIQKELHPISKSWSLSADCIRDLKPLWWLP